MAHGKQAARDLLYGRQGGRVVPAEPAAGKPADKPKPRRQRPESLDREDSRDDFWFCLARMAHALSAALADDPTNPLLPRLTEQQREAMRRYPTPPSIFDPLPSASHPPG